MTVYESDTAIDNAAIHNMKTKSFCCYDCDNVIVMSICVMAKMFIFNLVSIISDQHHLRVFHELPELGKPQRSNSAIYHAVVATHRHAHHRRRTETGKQHEIMLSSLN